MKLTQSKLTDTLSKLADGKTVYQARKVAGISVRRVYQVKEAFDKTGEIPQIGKLAGRPRKPFEEWEIITIKQAFVKYRVSADTLERLIDRDYKTHIGHNRIHQILVYLGYAEKKNKKDIIAGTKIIPYCYFVPPNTSRILAIGFLSALKIYTLNKS